MSKIRMYDLCEKINHCGIGKGFVIIFSQKPDANTES